MGWVAIGRREVQPGKQPFFFLVANVPVNDDTIHVYLCIPACVNRSRMACVCFDVDRESGNVKYAHKVRRDQ